MARTTDPAAPTTWRSASTEARTVTGAHEEVIERSAISRETDSASHADSGA